MNLESGKNTPTNSPENQPKFQQLIIPGMEKILKKQHSSKTQIFHYPAQPPGIQIPG